MGGFRGGWEEINFFRFFFLVPFSVMYTPDGST